MSRRALWVSEPYSDQEIPSRRALISSVEIGCIAKKGFLLEQEILTRSGAFPPSKNREI